MSFVDLFRRKWKHSDASVRAEAVKAMGPGDSDVLLRIARDDSDDHVRELAVKRIEDLDALLGLASGGPDEHLASLATARAGEILVGRAVQADDPEEAEAAVARIQSPTALADVAKRASHEGARTAALERLQDGKVLADVARTARREDTRIAAVERIEDQGVLRGLALDPRKEIAIAAIGRLDDTSVLEQVVKHAKVKAVRGRAQRRLGELRPETRKESEEAPAEVRQAAREQREGARRTKRARALCDAAEVVLAGVRQPGAAARLSELEAGWAELVAEGPVDAALASRFERARSAVAETVAAEAARAAEQQGRERSLRAAVEAREDLVSRVEPLRGEGDLPRLEELEAAFAALEPAAGSEVDAAALRFREAARRMRARVKDEERLRELRPALEAILVEVEEAVSKPVDEARKAMGTLRRRWREAASGLEVDRELAERLEALSAGLRQRELAEREARDQARQEGQLALEDLMTRLESSGEITDLRAAEALLREAREQGRRASSLVGRKAWGELRDRHRDAERALAARVAELREADDWNRHFNLRKQEELCAKVEALAGLEDKAEVARQLRAAQQEWRAVSRGPRGSSNDLWKRFKTAGDQVYEHCAQQFEELKNERQTNLQKKVAICEEAERLVESTEWKATADRLKELQAEWKAVGPVRRKDSDAVWKRFRAACDAYFERRKEHFKALDAERSGNMQKKLELCEKAEALADSSDWVETAEALKALQAEWRATGPVPRKHSDAVWGRFRAACDRFFARREEHLDGGRRQNLERKDALCAELEGLFEGLAWDPSNEEVPVKLLAAWREWKEIGAIPFDEVERTQGRLEGICARIVEACPQAFAGTELDPTVAVQRRLRLCEKVEALAERLRGAGTPTGDGEEELSVAERLREAMARNTFREESRADDRQKAQDELAGLLHAWKSCAPAPGAEAPELVRRFEAASAAAVEVVGQPGESES